MWNTFDYSRTQLMQEIDHSNLKEDTALSASVCAILEGDESASYSQKKAKALAYILNNGALDVGAENIFAYRINHCEIMKTHLSRRKKALKTAITPATAKKAEKSCTFKANLDFAHISPDWHYLLERGLSGAIEDLKGERTYDQERFLVYDAIRNCFLRFAEKASALATPKGDFIAKNLRHLAIAPPETLAQAIQLILLFYVMQTHLDTVIVRSLGGLDRLLYPFYKSDLATKRFSKEQLAEIIKYFFQTISSMKVCANIPFYICGTDDSGRDATNEFTYFLLEQYRALDIYDPKIHVMYHENIDKNVLRLILETIRDGKNSFVFINTKLASSALENVGISEKDAKRVIIYGCYEPAAEGTEIPCTCGGMVNLAKSIELALESQKEFTTFDCFYQEVLGQLCSYTEACMEAIAAYEPHYKDICPSLILSPTFQKSRGSGIDIYSGGAKYNNTSIVGAGLATLVDSLVAVKKVVFEEKLKTFDEFRSILFSNWQQDENLRLLIKKKYSKFGNNTNEADELAVDIYNRFSNLINGRKNGRGGVFRCGMFSVDWRFWMGDKTGATPDGRRLGEPLSKNLAASIGQDKNGVTAYLNSLLKLDGEQCPDGYVADVVLHCSAVKDEEGMTAFKSLLTTFMKKGGFSIHFNILSPETLLNAQKEPEKYQNLQIRLCGWNVRFVDLDKAQQDEFIKQSVNVM